MCVCVCVSDLSLRYITPYALFDSWVNMTKPVPAPSVSGEVEGEIRLKFKKKTRFVKEWKLTFAQWLFPEGLYLLFLVTLSN